MRNKGEDSGRISEIILENRNKIKFIEPCHSRTFYTHKEEGHIFEMIQGGSKRRKEIFCQIILLKSKIHCEYAVTIL